MANNQTRAIIEDSHGNMWVSWKDITKFDGTNWTVYDSILPYHYFRDIAEDIDGNLWFISDAGLLKYDGTNWISYDSTADGSHIGGWAVCADSHGNIWCEWGYIFKYDGIQWIKYDSTNSNLTSYLWSRDIMEDASGNIWFCGIQGVYKYDGTNWTVFSYENGTLPDSYWFRTMKQDTSGNIWMGTYSSGILKYDGNVWTQYDTSNGLLYNNSYGLAIDNQNNIWQGILYDNGGVYKFNGTSGTYYDTSNGLINNFIYTVYKDKSGNLWFGTAGGVSKLILNTGLELFSRKTDGVIIYPNPTNANFTISINTSEEIKYDIEIKDVFGKTVAVKYNLGNNANIDISELKSGMYFVKIKMKDSEVVKKIIKS